MKEERIYRDRDDRDVKHVKIGAIVAIPVCGYDKMEHFIICRPNNHGEVSLINIRTGIRWAEPVNIPNGEKYLSYDEFAKLISKKAMGEVSVLGQGKDIVEIKE